MADFRERLSQRQQVKPENRRLVADLPAQTQMNAINTVLSGKSTGNQQIDNFIRQSATQGQTPDQIRQTFIAQQRRSPSPLIILGGR